RRHRRPLSHRRPRGQRHLRGRRLRVLRRYLAGGPRRLLSPARAPGPSSLNTLGLRLLPGAVLIAATVALLIVPALAPLAMWLLPAYPLLVFLAGALLAWRGRLPAIGLLAFSGALALAGLRLTLRPQALECGMFWALVAALLAFGAAAPASASIALAGAGLVLLVSLVETSHAIAYGDELTG